MTEAKTLSEDELKRVRSLYSKFQDGDEELLLMKADTGIMVVGKSNIGKTTLCHLIAKTKLKVVDNLGLAAIGLEDPAATKALIGMEGVSCTDIPNHFVIDFNGAKYHLYDCPGLCDSNKFESLISNSYYVYSTFLNIPQNIFVLVVAEQGLTGGAASEFIETVKLFLNYFEIGNEPEPVVAPVPEPVPAPAVVPAVPAVPAVAPVVAPVVPPVPPKKKLKLE